MQSPLIKYNDTTAILPPMYCGSVGYYATLAAYKNVVIDCDMRYNKRQKSTHRCHIADTHGELMLTVPIVKPDNCRQATWNNIEVSTHGQWWNVHKTALFSAYGRTPFFEFYFDRFLQFFQHRNGEEKESLMSLDCGIDAIIRDILSIDSNVIYQLSDNFTDIKDYRNDNFVLATAVEYYQVRSQELGFIPNLSVLDLIFNMGTEAPLVLKEIISKHI